MESDMDWMAINPERIPQAIEPYSVAIRVGNLGYTSGPARIDPGTRGLMPGSVDAETRQALMNLQVVLQDSGSDPGQVVKTVVIPRDMADFATINAVTAEFFPQEPPSRSTTGLSGLPKGAAVEIEIVALVK